MIIKRFIKVFTYLGAVFLMSHIIFSNNVGAVDTVLDMNGYEVIDSAAAPKLNCWFSDTSLNATNVNACGGSPSTSTVTLTGFQTVEQYNMMRGDVVEFDILVWSPTNLANLNGFSPAIISAPYPFRVMSLTQKANNYFSHNMESITNGTGGTISGGGAYYSLFHYSLRYVGGNNVAYNLGWGSGNSLFTWSSWGSSGESLYFRMYNLVRWRLSGEGSTDQQNEINATNNAVDESETSGDQASTDATSATSSLLSVIGGFVNVITSASPSNCVIDAPLNTAFSNDRFNVDLCALDLPAGIGALTSIIAIMVIVPFCISMFNKFIGIISGFQQ